METPTRASKDKKIIFDFHIHTCYSFDSWLKPKEIIKEAKRKGLSGVAITDHNTIRGGLEAQEVNEDSDFFVIVGSEIATDIGDIIGLFLKEEIKSRVGIEVTEEIHNQGGIVILPHPMKGHILKEEILKKIDLIEVFNSRTSAELNLKALRLAEEYKKPFIVGSDAHFLSEIGACKVLISIENLCELKDKIRRGEFVIIERRYTPTYLQSLSQLIKSIKQKNFKRIPKNCMSLTKQILKYVINWEVWRK
jgi:predicted metal-dependent phosphoesterase TrpH